MDIPTDLRRTILNTFIWMLIRHLVYGSLSTNNKAFRSKWRKVNGYSVDGHLEDMKIAGSQWTLDRWTLSPLMSTSMDRRKAKEDVTFPDLMLYRSLCSLSTLVDLFNSLKSTEACYWRMVVIKGHHPNAHKSDSLSSKWIDNLFQKHEEAGTKIENSCTSDFVVLQIWFAFCLSKSQVVIQLVYHLCINNQVL